MAAAKVKVLLVISFIWIVSSSFVPAPQELGVFSFMLNNKPYVIKGFTAKYRTVTGGYKQLSLSNDFFTSFFFNNPTAKTFELSTAANREAIVRYTNPTTLITYFPEKGKINIATMDINAKVISGEFEVEMYQQDQPNKKIVITQGKFINVPIDVR